VPVGRDQHAQGVGGAGPKGAGVPVAPPCAVARGVALGHDAVHARQLGALVGSDAIGDDARIGAQRGLEGGKDDDLAQGLALETGPGPGLELVRRVLAQERDDPFIGRDRGGGGMGQGVEQAEGVWLDERNPGGVLAPRAG
jgi:hypothetical protein